MNIEIRKYEYGQLTVLELRGGTLNIGENSEALYLAARQLAESGKSFVVDLTKIRNIDSSGISTLVRLSIVAERSGGSFRIVASRDTRVWDALTVTRLIEAIPTFESLAGAAQAAPG